MDEYKEKNIKYLKKYKKLKNQIGGLFTIRTFNKPTFRVNHTKTQQQTQQLPEGWEELIDQTTGRKYYANHNTKQTQWEFPIEESQPIVNTSQQQTSQQVQQQEIINSLKKNWVNSTDNQKIIYTNNWCKLNGNKTRVTCKKKDNEKISRLGEIINTVDLNRTHYHFPPWN
tara:strand:+ start:413 stop:925 length:513 start_codon:yes stop_codon:yes gene_type:complete